MNSRKKDIVQPTEEIPPPEFLLDGENNPTPVTCRVVDYPDAWEVAPHAHTRHQLLHAVHGVMVVHADAGHWIVLPSRGLWIPAGMTHATRCIGEVHMRSLYIRQDAAPTLLDECKAVGISPLLRELIRAAAELSQPYQPDSRDGHLIRLLLDEMRALPVLPLHLPMPSDPRVLRICRHIQAQLDDGSTLADWAARLGVDKKTVQRLFAAQTGTSFGRWRQQARLLRALEMLASGEKIIDIALSLGYDSPSAFTTMFKKQFGLTPSQFFEAARD